MADRSLLVCQRVFIVSIVSLLLSLEYYNSNNKFLWVCLKAWKRSAAYQSILSTLAETVQHVPEQNTNCKKAFFANKQTKFTGKSQSFYIDGEKDHDFQWKGSNAIVYWAYTVQHQQFYAHTENDQLLLPCKTQKEWYFTPDFTAFQSKWFLPNVGVWSPRK